MEESKERTSPALRRTRRVSTPDCRDWVRRFDRQLYTDGAEERRWLRSWEDRRILLELEDINANTCDSWFEGEVFSREIRVFRRLAVASVVALEGEGDEGEEEDVNRACFERV
jgi:hypothetical protein